MIYRSPADAAKSASWEPGLERPCDVKPPCLRLSRALVARPFLCAHAIHSIEIHGQRIRLHGIDAPESRQLCDDARGKPYRCGQKAALALSDNRPSPGELRAARRGPLQVRRGRLPGGWSRTAGWFPRAVGRLPPVLAGLCEAGS